MSIQFDLINDPNYRPNVGIMLVNQAHQVLAGEAAYCEGEWMMPQGGMDADETALQTMQRELFEETSIVLDQVRLIKEHNKWLDYEFNAPLEKAGIVYIGQRQKWFLLEYNGDLPDPTKTQDQEFVRFDWVTPEWLIGNTTQPKARVYRTIFSEFSPYFP